MPDELKQRQINLSDKDWERAKTIGANQVIKASRSQTIAAALRIGLDRLEKSSNA